MRVFIKNENSSINNKDIRWYLADQILWISTEENYENVEKLTDKSFGSFNWLYDMNDTLLFEKNSGKFRLSIINLSKKINVIQDAIQSDYKEMSGDLFLVDKDNFKFEFQDVNYVEIKDYLLSCPENYVIGNNLQELSITVDFSFYIADNLLVGWILKNASKHLCVSDSNSLEETTGDKNTTALLSKYLKALKLWEENEDEDISNDFKKILDMVDTSKDMRKRAIKEGVSAILEW